MIQNKVTIPYYYPLAADNKCIEIYIIQINGIEPPT
jgi:hypothetical protein